MFCYFLGVICLLCGVEGALVKGKWFDRIFIIQFENTGFTETSQNADFKALAEHGQLMTNYYAVTHPSQPNYWAQVCGDFFNFYSDANRDLDYSNLADLLDQKRISWRAYQEDLPTTPCFLGASSGNYARKHNPFISFVSIQRNASRCANIVHSNQFDVDLANGNLPSYSYYTPNQMNDAHDSGIDFGGRYLSTFFSTRLSRFPSGTLIVVTFDEDKFGDEGNRIFTLLLGDVVRPNTTDDTRYNHYSLLRTVEDNWALGDLGRNDKTAVPFKYDKPPPPVPVAPPPKATPVPAPVSVPATVPVKPPVRVPVRVPFPPPLQPMPVSDDNSFIVAVAIILIVILVVVIVCLVIFVPSVRQRALVFLHDCFGIRYNVKKVTTFSHVDDSQEEQGSDVGELPLEVGEGESISDVEGDVGGGEEINASLSSTDTD